MADEKKDEPDKGEGKLYSVDTVPPPAGEDDAYSAPTKVGPLGDAFVQGLMKDAEQRSTDLARKEKKPQPEAAPISKRPALDESPPSSKEPVSAGGTPLPRIYDEADEEENEDAATKLSPKAKPPEVPRRPMNLQVPTDAPAAPAPPPAPVPPPPVDILKQFAPDLAPPSSSPAPLPPIDAQSRAPIPFEQPLPESQPGGSKGRTVALLFLLVVLAVIAVLLFTRHG